MCTEKVFVEEKRIGFLKHFWEQILSNSDLSQFLKLCLPIISMRTNCKDSTKIMETSTEQWICELVDTLEQTNYKKITPDFMKAIMITSYLSIIEKTKTFWELIISYIITHYAEQNWNTIARTHKFVRWTKI